MNILFICNQNQNRSKTAAEVFNQQWKTQSAGLFNERPVTKQQLEWADKIVVMEAMQRKELGERFPNEYLKKQIISLDIPDIYNHNDPGLIRILKNKANELI